MEDVTSTSVTGDDPMQNLEKAVMIAEEDTPNNEKEKEKETEKGTEKETEKETEKGTEKGTEKEKEKEKAAEEEQPRETEEKIEKKKHKHKDKDRDRSRERSKKDRKEKRSRSPEKEKEKEKKYKRDSTSTKEKEKSRDGSKDRKEDKKEGKKEERSTRDGSKDRKEKEKEKEIEKEGKKEERSGTRDGSKDRKEKEGDKKEGDKKEGKKEERSGRDRDKDRDKDRDRSSDRKRTKERSPDRPDRKTDKRDRDRSVDRRRDRTRDRSPDRRDRDRRRDRSMDRRRDRDRSPDRDRRRNRDRSLDNRRDSRRDSGRDRDRSRDRSRRERDRSKSPSNDRRGKGNRSYEFNPYKAPSDDKRSDKERKETDDKPSNGEKEEDFAYKAVTLKEVLTSNPGISMQEAATRMNAHNSAIVNGLVPTPITEPVNKPGILNGGAGLVGVTSSSGAYMLANSGTQSSSTVSGAAVGGSADNAVAVASDVPIDVGEGGALMKPHRDLYLGNIPPGITIDQLKDFITAALTKVGFGSENKCAVVSCWISSDTHYAFLETRTLDQATAAVTYLNGVTVGQYSLRIGRPKGYTPMINPTLASTLLTGNPLSAVTAPELIVPAIAAAAALEAASNVVMVNNVPTTISVEDIRELVGPFGELKAFNVVKTPDALIQTAVCEFVDPSNTEAFIIGMNKLEIAGMRFSATKVPHQMAAILLRPPPVEVKPKSSPSRVIRLENMTDAETFEDQELYDELLDDTNTECSKYGSIQSITVPKTTDECFENATNGEVEPVGFVYVLFTHMNSAEAAVEGLDGRKFNGQTVTTDFYPEELYVSKVGVAKVKDEDTGGAAVMVVVQDEAQGEDAEKVATNSVGDVADVGESIVVDDTLNGNTDGHGVDTDANAGATAEASGDVDEDEARKGRSDFADAVLADEEEEVELPVEVEMELDELD